MADADWSQLAHVLTGGARNEVYYPTNLEGWVIPHRSPAIIGRWGIESGQAKTEFILSSLWDIPSLLEHLSGITSNMTPPFFIAQGAPILHYCE